VGGGIRTGRAREENFLPAPGALADVIAGSPQLFPKTARSDLRVRDRAPRRRRPASASSPPCGQQSGHVVIHGWKTTLPLTAGDTVRALEPVLRRVSYTHVDAKGLMGGTNIEAIVAVRNATSRRNHRRWRDSRRGRRSTISTRSASTPVVGMAILQRAR